MSCTDSELKCFQSKVYGVEILLFLRRLIVGYFGEQTQDLILNLVTNVNDDNLHSNIFGRN